MNHVNVLLDPKKRREMENCKGKESLRKGRLKEKSWSDRGNF